MREEGYYKVKYHNRWIVVEYFNKGWWLCGIGVRYFEENFDEIGDKIEL